MSALNSLLLAVELATRRRDAAVLAVLQARRTLEHGRSQLAQLEDYVAEKDARLVAPRSTGLSVELMRHHYQFMARLQHAIGLQTDMVGQLQHKAGQAEVVLRNAEIRLQSLQKVVQLRQAQVQQQKNRIEQRQTDEFASQQYARKRIRSRKGAAS